MACTCPGQCRAAKWSSVKPFMCGLAPTLPPALIKISNVSGGNRCGGRSDATVFHPWGFVACALTLALAPRTIPKSTPWDAASSNKGVHITMHGITRLDIGTRFPYEESHDIQTTLLNVVWPCARAFSPFTVVQLMNVDTHFVYKIEDGLQAVNGITVADVMQNIPSLMVGNSSSSIKSSSSPRLFFLDQVLYQITSHPRLPNEAWLVLVRREPSCRPKRF